MTHETQHRCEEQGNHKPTLTVLSANDEYNQTVLGGQITEGRTGRAEKPFVGNGIFHSEDAPLMTF